MNTNDLKILAYYLPQFHEVEENNKWWGKGYTEWRNADNAAPLFRGHYQPRKPLNDNYYDLLDKHTMKWQAELAKKNGINGFCFYHYWFEGRKLLEKPAEKLLADKEIDMPFCFAWANHSWSKTWEGPGGEKQILMRQTYGNRDSWEKHFQYLLQFFKDDRYIKKNNKPVFMVYAIENIARYHDMFGYFDKEAQKAGFGGIYVIQMLRKAPMKKSKYVNAYTTYVPGMFNDSTNETIRELKFKINKYINTSKLPSCVSRFFYDIYDYDKCMKALLNRKYAKNEYMGIFPSFDNTARRGKRAWIYKGATPKKFEKYLTELIKMSLKAQKDMLFITAWNEWGEGNYLEPDTRYGFAWLNAVKRARRNNEE